jgi:hypothetical protein
MKNIIKDKIIAIFSILAIMTLAFTPLMAIAADMWAETPDLNVDQEDHGVSISGRGRLVNNFNPEMYAETPDLNKGFTNRHMKVFEEITIADN